MRRYMDEITPTKKSAHSELMRWDDPAIGIEGRNVADAETLSAKDRRQPLLADLPDYSTWSE